MMGPFAQLFCAVAGSAILYMGLRAIRVGYFATMQGRLWREKSPKLFGSLVVFWIGASLFLFAVAVGVFQRREPAARPLAPSAVEH